MKKLLAITAAAAVIAMAGTAMAATTTTNLTVSAKVDSVCTASTVTNIDFGTLNPLTDPATSNTATKTGATRGQISVACTAGTSYSFTADNAPVMTRTLGTETIAYTAVLPTPVAGSVAGTTYYVDAEVQKTAYEAAPAGAYSGNLTVTVTY